MSDDVWVKDAQSGELFRGSEQQTRPFLESGQAVLADPAEVEASKARERQGKLGLEGQLLAGGSAFLRGAIPFVGDDLAELVGYGDESEQRAQMQAHPTISGASELAGFVSTSLVPGAIFGKAAKAVQVIGRLSQAARAAEELNLVTRGIGMAARGAAAGAGAELSHIESDRILYGERDSAAIADDILSAAKTGALLNVLAGTAGGVLRRVEARRAAKAAKSSGLGNGLKLEDVEALHPRRAANAPHLRRVFDRLLPTEQPVANAALRQAKFDIRSGAELGEVMAGVERDLAPLGPASRSAVQEQIGQVMKDELTRREIGQGAFGPLARTAGQSGLGRLFDGLPGMVIGGTLLGGGKGGLTGGLLHLGRRFLSPVLSPIAFGAARASVRSISSPVGRRFATGVIPQFVTHNTYSDVRDAFVEAPSPERQTIELVQAGIPEDAAGQIISRREAIRSAVAQELPESADAPRYSFAAANRLIDAIVRPAAVLERMRRLESSAEDMRVIKAVDAEALMTLQGAIAAQYQAGRNMFTIRQRAQHELIIGQSIGIGGAALMRFYKSQMQERQQRASAARGGQFDQLVNPEMKRTRP